MVTERSSRRSVAGLLIAAASIAISSCSPGEALQAVSGKVSVNGKPAVGALLVFHPEGGDIKSIPATATAGEDGTFTLVTGSKGGARAGKYMVTVIWPDPSKKPTEQQLMMGLASEAPDLLAGRFSNPKTTPLRAEIKTGQTNLEPFELN